MLSNEGKTFEINEEEALNNLYGDFRKIKTADPSKQSPNKMEVIGKKINKPKKTEFNNRRGITNDAYLEYLEKINEVNIPRVVEKNSLEKMTSPLQFATEEVKRRKVNIFNDPDNLDSLLSIHAIPTSPNFKFKGPVSKKKLDDNLDYGEYAIENENTEFQESDNDSLRKTRPRLVFNSDKYDDGYYQPQKESDQINSHQHNSKFADEPNLEISQEYYNVSQKKIFDDVVIPPNDSNFEPTNADNLKQQPRNNKKGLNQNNEARISSKKFESVYQMNNSQNSHERRSNENQIAQSNQNFKLINDYLKMNQENSPRLVVNPGESPSGVSKDNKRVSTNQVFYNVYKNIHKEPKSTEYRFYSETKNGEIRLVI